MNMKEVEGNDRGPEGLRKPTKILSREPVSDPIFEPGTTRIQSMRINPLKHTDYYMYHLL
jgi:hypothetical protein